MIALMLLGSFVGLLSGFFGIGGGTILIPLLLLLGYETKVAIGISVVQMVFSSIYGSYLNNKKGTLDIKMVSIIGIGGFAGALFSGYITTFLSDRSLEMLFLSFALFALFRMFFKTHEDAKEKELHYSLLLLIGILLGAFSMTMGVGGSILLVPVLVGFLHISLQKAVSSGLFFVVFSSVAGLISHAAQGHMDYKSGIIIGVTSLLGVYLGIHLKERVSYHLQKRLLVGFYLFIVLYLVNRIFF